MSLSLKISLDSSIVALTDEFERKGSEIILGKPEVLKLTLCALISRGHLLIEDLPGMGKTTLVKFLARATGLDFQRIQFTSDLLPSDIIGVSIFDQNEQRFRFHRGPIFGQLVLGDELNRASPKTQSAFLQAMEEHRITVDGHTHTLPDPFFLVATQNPRQQIGTFPLPESQLDRFLMRLTLGYPSRQAENQLLSGAKRQTLIDNLQPIVTVHELVKLQEQAELVFASPPIINYIQDILEASRTEHADLVGLSPRAGRDLLAASRSWAYMHGRDIVLPEDVQAVTISVINHRLYSSGDITVSQAQDQARELIRTIRVH